MAQHDQVIDNGPGLAVRTDINAALAALFSSNSGAVEPAVKVAGQLWFNTSSGQLQMRNAANTAWTSLTGSLGGTVAINPAPVIFEGTSTDAATALMVVKDNRTTTGATGNTVFAIRKQNAPDASLILGNDGNGAGLIGGNNVPLRFGNWMSGVFTEYVNLSTGGKLAITGDLEIDPSAAVSGINIKPSDTNSGRLFFTGTTKVWSVSAWESDGTLLFSSGGTYGSSTGTARARMYESGAMSIGSFMDATYFQVSAGLMGTQRARFTGTTAAGAGQAIVHSFDDAGVEDSRITSQNALMAHRSMTTNPNSHEFSLQESDGTSRAKLMYTTSTQQWVRLEGRDTAGVFYGSIAVVGTKGAQYAEFATSSGEGEAGIIITTGNLERTTYTGGDAANTSFPVGSIVLCDDTSVNRNTSATVRIGSAANLYSTSGTGAVLAGTWRGRGTFTTSNSGTLMQRVA
ncbi:phage tail protein [Ensifer sp. IC3342]|nr:phage tail protein [Ensifer sp. BRP08]MCA1446932.1 phage tail protein [Ensifer sp. IC3342]